MKTTPSKLYTFLESPKTAPGYIFQGLIITLIIVSLLVLAVESYLPTIVVRFQRVLQVVEYTTLGVFTVEYVLRLATAPNKLKFVRKPLSVVDFLAIFPAYLELLFVFIPNLMPLRALRILRILRLARVVRILKLVRYQKLLQRILRYNGTVLESISYLILFMVVVKASFWTLEYYRVWSPRAELGELFAIIGFALGIILSQKIGSTYDKFIQIEETTVRIYGTLQSLMLILNSVKKDLGSTVCRRWARMFVEELKSKDTKPKKMNLANVELYHAIAQAEADPAELAILHGELCRDSSFCISKRSRLTPRAYDTLLHQATIVYLLMIAVFLPGATGMISVLLATYILYGMYNVTQDLDSILGGEFNLINIDVSELEQFSSNEQNR